MTRPVLLIALLLTAQAAVASQLPIAELRSATPWAAGQTTIEYVVFDADDDVTGALRYSLYVYPDAGLRTAQDVLTFAIMIANQQDVLLEIGSGDFTESASEADVQSYTWGDPGDLQFQANFAPASAAFPGDYYIYLIVRDGDNEPVMAVSDFAVTIHDAPTAIGDVTWGWVKSAR